MEFFESHLNKFVTLFQFYTTLNVRNIVLLKNENVFKKSLSENQQYNIFRYISPVRQFSILKQVSSAIILEGPYILSKTVNCYLIYRYIFPEIVDVLFCILPLLHDWDTILSEKNIQEFIMHNFFVFFSSKKFSCLCTIN